MEEYKLDKKLVAAAFNKAADHYDDVSVVQREVGKNLLERLDMIRLEPRTILDLGASTGYFSKQLQDLYPDSKIISLDIAEQLLKKSDNAICADAEKIPLKNNSVDFVFSNFLLHWCPNLEGAFAEIFRVLRPEGLFLFSIPGPDTLWELREAWEAADNHTHVNAFYDMHDIGDALLRVKFSDPVMDVNNITVSYADVMKMMKELKMLGAHNVTQGRPRGLMTKKRLQKVIDAYEQFKLKDGTFPMTYEVIYGHAWGREVANIKGIAVHAG